MSLLTGTIIATLLLAGMVAVCEVIRPRRHEMPGVYLYFMDVGFWLSVVAFTLWSWHCVLQLFMEAVSGYM